ncbi:MAG: DNA-protecting protein DprA [Solirubrobacterales bacterium]|nr:DNA-protecting protein DprA [Solirubrobacterales bacterium]
MIAEHDRAAMVALLRTGRRPWVEYAALVEERGSAEAVFDEELGSPGGQTTLLPEPAESADELIETARSDLERWAARGMRLVTVLDSDYPPNLRAVHDRPPMVFVAGTLRQSDARSVAVVGARQATPSGIEQAAKIAEHLVDRKYTVVSGLAAGIDTAAHTTALSRHGRTLAVIGTGLARAYPPQNQPLQRRIADQCAVVSQFWPDSPPTRRSFPMRNAVMSGIALATVVVEASHTSGARIQTRLALAQGRPVFLLGSLVDRQAWAREYADRAGTHVVHEPEQITNVIDRLMTSDSPLVA